MQSVLHAPTYWKAQRGGHQTSTPSNGTQTLRTIISNTVSTIRTDTRSPKSAIVRAAAARGHVTLRVAFPATLSQDTPSTPLPLSGLTHVVDEGSSDYVLNRGSSIPQSVVKGKVTQIPHDRS